MTQMFDPIAHADHFFGQLYREAETASIERDRESARMAASFVKACAQADANALAFFAPTVRDWNAAKAMPVSSTSTMPHRHQTIAEVMQEGLDYASGPSMTEAMQLILNVAYGTDLVNAPEQARALISRMATTFANYNHSED